MSAAAAISQLRDLFEKEKKKKPQFIDAKTGQDLPER